jgi:hypothetical protein
MSGKDMDYAESSRFWIKETLSWVVHHPLLFLELEAKKWLWSVYYNPPAVNNSVHFESEFIPLLDYLAMFTWLALACGLAAFPLMWRCGKARFLIFLWGGYWLLILVYYASDRFLVTMLPFAAIGTGLLLQEIIDRKKTFLSNIKHRAWLPVFWAMVVALTINPFFWQHQAKEIGFGYYNLGVLHESRNNWRNARDQYQNALQYLPSYPPVLLNLGVVYARLGNLELSTRLFEKVLDLDPDNPTAKRNLSINRKRLQE